MLETDDNNTSSKISYTAPADEFFTGVQKPSSDGLSAASAQLVTETANETTKSSYTTAPSESDVITSHVSVGTSGHYSSQQPGTASMHTVDYDGKQESEPTSMNEEATYIKSENDHSPYFDANTTEPVDTEIEESAVTDVCSQSKDCFIPQHDLSTSTSGETDVDTITYSDSKTQDLLKTFSEAKTHVSGILDESEVKTTENTNFGSENLYDQHHSNVVPTEPETQTEKTSTVVSMQEQEPSFTSEMVTNHIERTPAHSGGSTSQDTVSSESAQGDIYARLTVTENIPDTQPSSTTNNDLSPVVNLSTGLFEPHFTPKASVPQADSSSFTTEVSGVSQYVDSTTAILVDPVNTEAVEKELTEFQTGEVKPSEVMHSVDSSYPDSMAYASTDTSEESSEASIMQGNTSQITMDSEEIILSSSSWVKEPSATVISLSSDGETSDATDAVLSEKPVSHYFAPSTYITANSDSLTEESFSDIDSTITGTGQDEMTSTANATPESVTVNDMKVLTQKEPEGTPRDTELSIENASTENESDEYLQSTPIEKVVIKTASPTTAVQSTVNGPEYTVAADDLALGVLTDASNDVSTSSEEDNFETVASTSADEGAVYSSEKVSNESGSQKDYTPGRSTAFHSDAPLSTTETDQSGMPENEETDDSDELEFTQFSPQTNTQPSEDSKGQVDHNELITLKDVSDVTPSEAWEATDRVNSGDGEELVAYEDDIATADQTTFLYLRGSQFRIPRYTKTSSARTVSESFAVVFATFQLVLRF
ncbi:hypothetical protein AAHC03_019297 [Spirometra sp. Aus1]